MIPQRLGRCIYISSIASNFKTLAKPKLIGIA